ncbi:hypothetical protein ASE74_17340 [Pedobacter sp. Leaf216]|uniref:DUF1223 domain-containing protein n=1 Tax=Pedobacter sp. Leaf216 TaxID=1735684 RepID=UPI0006FA3348|nr:DUF1223 domain-containing protein [Pedobacter sp. Leaf216]KQM77030.1 hypothetical protein ASE74_17340 [Pedobacter sp. Leaf216]
MIRKIALPLLVIGFLGVAFVADQKNNPNSPEKGGFAVVELFTSEGCSSCPPADALLAQIEKESQNKPVYLLAFHVDYWDRLGWKDSFSSSKFSARQNQYANWLKLKTVYTPQVVVNGSKEFIGSEENTLRNSIKTALANPSTGNLAVALSKSDKDKLTLNYNTDQPTDGYSLAVALVLAKASNRILKGENKGLTLSHVQIVSQFETFALGGKSGGSVQINKLNGQQPTELIAFLQENKTGKITAATRLKYLDSNTLTNKSE